METSGGAEMNVCLVASKEFTVIEPVCDDGSGPATSDRDVIYVEAPNKRQAKIRAVQYWRKKGNPPWELDECPFTGLDVELFHAPGMEEADYEWSIDCPWNGGH